MNDARSLLAGMLGRIRRGGDTPLQFGIDSAAIVRASVEEGGGRCRVDELDALASEILGVPWTAGASSVEAWMERFYLDARTVDPQALEIVGQRFDGFDDREIAERLSLGPRLVRRIIKDIACCSR